MGRNTADLQIGIQGFPQTAKAGDILGHVALGDHDDLMGRFDFAGGDDRTLLRHKYRQATEKGLKDDILQNGIQSPVEIHVDNYGDKTLTEGHHRLAVMLKHRPATPIPIKYWRG